MRKPKMLRKRFIPNEVVDISGDDLLYRDDELLITSWRPIRPRDDFAWGISFTFLEEGYKISKFYDKNDSFLYWYCDVIEVEYCSEKDEYLFTDLLLDIKIFPDGKIHLLDMDELTEAFDKNIISRFQIVKAIQNFSKLTNMINNDEFPPQVCLQEEMYK